MADEEGPDPNDVRRHAKRMFTEMQYRQKYCRLDFYRPNRKQLEFHNLIADERMLRAGNQEGKTHAAAAELSMHGTQRYPGWFKGRTFLTKPPIERPYDFLGWVAGPNAVKVRDGMQTKLLGNLMEPDGLGTGLIPLDCLTGKPAMARGIADFVDSVTIRREDGGKALIRFKTYEQGRQAFEGEAVDVVELDEDVKGETNAPIYGECQARTTTTRGIIMVTMTPMLGLTPIRRRFKQQSPGTAEVLMTLDDALVSNGGHIPDEDVPRLLAKYKGESERQTRLYGADMQGEGAVFETPLTQVKEQIDPSLLPPYWPWIWGLDFRHSGSVNTGHPFAAVLCCWDRDADVIHVVHGVRLLGLASTHVDAMKRYPMWEAPCAYPHDGGRGGSIVDGDTIAKTYKKLGLNMRDTHATFSDGGYDFEAGLREMEERLASGRLRVAAHLHEWFDEYQGYHRVNGLVNKVDDDLLSATRQAIMDIRFAKTAEGFPSVFRRPIGGRSNFARGSAGHPDGEYSIFGT